MSYDNSSREKTICGKSHFRNTVLVCKDNVLFDEAMKKSLKRVYQTFISNQQSFILFRKLTNE